MKRFKPFVIILISATLLLSCKGENGVDGVNGRAYLTVSTSDGLLYAYIDNNSSRPGNFYQGVTYRVSPGSYDFAYESRVYNTNGTFYYTQWVGTYRIHFNAGEEGEKGKILWQKGEDGENGPDSYLTLLCNFDGPYQQRINKAPHGIVRSIPDSSITMKRNYGEYTISISAKLKSYGTDQSRPID